MLKVAGSAMSEDRARLSRRLLALTGLWFFLGGLLMALSFVVAALVVFGVLLSIVAAAGGIWLLRRVRTGERLWVALGSTARAAQVLTARARDLGVRRHARRLGSRARTTATGVPARTDALVARGLRSYAITVYRLKIWTSKALLARTQPGGSDQALRLNELGAQLRRRGEPEQAAEQHRVALEIARDLGDEEAEALTLNSLALALAEGGAEEEAVQHLEQARVVLHKLGDDEHEGQVIANLGLVHQRQGHEEEAVNLLHEALDKLPPESSAYRRIEQELVRAG
jgi:tetratricopeptide (TPR) repeat protein